MSWQAKDWGAQVIRSLSLTNRRRATPEAFLMELCDRHSPDQMPYGLMERLAGKLGTSKRSVQRAARLLEQRGVLWMEPIAGRRCRLFLSDQT